MARNTTARARTEPRTRPQNLTPEQMQRLAKEKGLEYLSYDITKEPIPDSSTDGLDDLTKARINAIGEAAIAGRAAELVPEIERLLTQHPDVPKLHNFRMVALMEAGRREEAEAAIRDIYARFPDYVFGIAQYVDLLVEEDDLDGAGRVLGKKLDIGKRYPDRKVFHLTEVIAYSSAVARYLRATGNLESAWMIFDALDQMAPDHPNVLALGHQLARANFADRMMRFVARSRSHPKRKPQKRKGESR